LKKILLTFLTIIFIIMGFHIDVSARTHRQHKSKSSAIHHREKNTIKTSVSNTINPKDIVVIHEYNLTKNIVKNYGKQNGVNGSFFDPKTLKVFGVLVTGKDNKTNTIYNRPTIIIKKDNSIEVIEDNLTSLKNIKYAVGAGGYLTINGKVSISYNTHFSSDFYKLRVNRTVIAITTDNKFKIMTFRSQSLHNIAYKLSKDSSLKMSLFLDGGSSTQNKFSNSGRKVPVHILW